MAISRRWAAAGGRRVTPADGRQVGGGWVAGDVGASNNAPERRSGQRPELFVAESAHERVPGFREFETQPRITLRARSWRAPTPAPLLESDGSH